MELEELGYAEAFRIVGNDDDDDDDDDDRDQEHVDLHHPEEEQQPPEQEPPEAVAPIIGRGGGGGGGGNHWPLPPLPHWADTASWQRDLLYAKTAKQIYNDYKTAEALFVAVEVAVRREHLKHTILAALTRTESTSMTRTSTTPPPPPLLPIEVISLVAEFAVESQLPNHSTPSLATIIKDRGTSNTADPLKQELAGALASKRVRSIVYNVQKEEKCKWDYEASWKHQLRMHWKSLHQQLCCTTTTEAEGLDKSSSTCPPFPVHQETVSTTRTRVCLSSFYLGPCERRRSCILEYLPKVAKGMPRFLPSSGPCCPRYHTTTSRRTGWEYRTKPDESLYYIQKKTKQKKTKKKRTLIKGASTVGFGFGNC